MKLAGLLPVFLAVAANACAADFIAGADFSHLAFFEARGAVYRDAGEARDGLEILKRHGLTCVRLRLFTSSATQAATDPYNFTNNLEYTLPLACRVKKAGLQFMLDFHYSDTWADPGHQGKPAAWTQLTFTELVQQMRQYNSNCIAAFKAAGAMPDYVQVGNEISSGMLFPDGHVGGTDDTPAQWVKLGQLVKSAVQGLQDASGAQMPKVIIHIDRGGDWNGTKWFFDNLLQQKVAFDIIGESYYPFWHGPLENLRTCLTNAAARYGKPLLVAETAFPWSGTNFISGIPAGTNGQVEFVVALAKLLKGVPRGLGTGILWWGAEYQSVGGVGLASFDQRSFFDAQGNVLPVTDALGRLVAPLVIKADSSGQVLTLSWPLSGAGCSLTTTSNLTGLAPWLEVTNPVQNTGLDFNTSLPIAAGDSSFYRLQSN